LKGVQPLFFYIFFFVVFFVVFFFFLMYFTPTPTFEDGGDDILLPE